MKKLISILLCLNFLAGLITVYADEENTAAYAKEIALLNYMNILSGSETADFDNKVTRAEFVNYVSKLYEKDAAPKERYFKDVPVDYWANSSINSMVDRGIIALNEDAMFYPEKGISLSEACKILLCMTGYEIYAESNGGYPSGYMEIASRNKIVPAISNSNEITFGEAIQMMYNALLMPAVEINMGNGQLEYSVNDNKTLAAQLKNVYVETGKITSVYGAVMPGSYNIREKEVCIDYEKYDLINDLMLDNLFADYVRYIYVLGDDDSKSVLYAEKINKGAEDVVIESKNIDKFDADAYLLSYHKNSSTGAMKNITLPKGITVIFNGYYYNGGIAEEINKLKNGVCNGIIKVKDFDLDGKYDTLLIESYKTIVVGYSNAEKTQFYSKYNPSEYIDTNEYDIVRICDKNGYNTEVESAGQIVLSVAESKNGEKIQIIPCNETVTGVINSWNTNDRTVLIDSTTYNVDKLIIDNVKKTTNGKSMIMVRVTFRIFMTHY